MIFPTSLVSAIHSGRILPAIGGFQGMSRQGELAKESFQSLFEALARYPIDTMIVLASGAEIEEALVGRHDGWSIVSGRSLAYAHNSRLLLATSGIVSKGTVEARRGLLSTIRDREPLLFDVMQSRAARRPIVFLDGDLEDQDLMEFARNLGELRHRDDRGWCIGWQTSRETVQMWNELGYCHVNGTASSLIALLPGSPMFEDLHAGCREVSVGRARSPFRGLENYDIDDGKVFFGRDREKQRLADIVCCRRLVVVSGASGAGKTSLLKAGLLDWMSRTPPFVGMYVRCMNDPVTELYRVLTSHLQVDLSAVPRPPTFAEIFSAASTFGNRLPVIIVDQAEELFTRFDEKIRDEFCKGLAKMLFDRHHHLRIVLGIREDFLPNLADWRDKVPPILQDVFYLAPLDLRNARTVVQESFAVCSIHLDTEVTDRILFDLGGDRVSPPQLSIICDALYALQKNRKVTLEQYASLGGARQILRHFLRTEVDKLGDSSDGARRILKAMVTAIGTKDVLALDQISMRGGQSACDTSRILEMLQHKVRAVRKVASDSGDFFELTHEYLTGEIFEWMTVNERRARELDESLVKEVRAWRKYKAVRLGAARLRHFAEHFYLLAPNGEALQLLLLSSVRWLEPTEVWLKVARTMDSVWQSQMTRELLSIALMGQLHERCDVAEIFVTLDPSPLCDALTADDARLRRIALELCGGIRLAVAAPIILQLLDDPDKETRDLACIALGECGGPQYAEIILGRVKEQSEVINPAAVRALGSAMVPQAFEIIEVALKSEVAQVVEAAKSAIAAARSEPLLSFLVERNPGMEMKHLILDALNNVRDDATQFAKVFVSQLPKQMLSNWRRYHAGWLQKLLQAQHIAKGGTPERSSTASNDLQALLGGSISHDNVVEALRKSNTWAVSDELAKKGIAALAVMRQLARDKDRDQRVCALMSFEKLKEYTTLEKTDWRAYLPTSILESALRSASALERYWASLAVAALQYADCVHYLRSLVGDDSEIEAGYYLSSVGVRVSDAVAYTLDRLCPASRVWRRDWQTIFRGRNVRA
jgi:hypothetical protein